MSRGIAAARPAPAIFSLQTLGDMAVPIGVLAIVMAMITPLPAFLLDFLISADIMLSVVVLMVSMYITKPVEFSTFPDNASAADTIPSCAEHLVFTADSS